MYLHFNCESHPNDWVVYFFTIMTSLSLVGLFISLSIIRCLYNLVSDLAQLADLINISESLLSWMFLAFRFSEHNEFVHSFCITKCCLTIMYIAGGDPYPPGQLEPGGQIWNLCSEPVDEDGVNPRVLILVFFTFLYFPPSEILIFSKLGFIAGNSFHYFQWFFFWIC